MPSSFQCSVFRLQCSVFGRGKQSFAPEKKESNLRGLLGAPRLRHDQIVSVLQRFTKKKNLMLA